MTIETGATLGAALCHALGLDPERVATMSLDLEPKEPARLRIQRYLSRAEAQVVTKTLERYRLIPEELYRELEREGRVR